MSVEPVREQHAAATRSAATARADSARRWGAAVCRTAAKRALDLTLAAWSAAAPLVASAGPFGAEPSKGREAPALDVRARVALRPTPAPYERGVALGLFSMEASHDYRPAVREIAALGATHVSLANVYWQADRVATEIFAKGGWTATEAQVEAAALEARRLGLHVTLFPILRLVQAGRGEWRGNIAPRDLDAWWASYGAWIEAQVDLAQRIGARRLAIGSELSSREHERARWAALIERIRARAPELELVYSANWDHFVEVSFWDLVDVVGVSAYFELAKTNDADVEALRRGLEAPTAALARFAALLGRRLVFTEFGFPSLDGGAMYPWDQTRRAPIDLDEQARAYEAFLSTLARAPFVAGSYAWTWFGPGGPACGDYTPRGKPAADVVARQYAAIAADERARTSGAPAPARPREETAHD
jgi:hypothetical protein